jgi:cyclopropane-fatty-acyl-phospholipid synthase
MAGDWTVGDGTDLGDLLTPFAARVAQLVPPYLLHFRRVVDRRVPRLRRNTPTGARENISAHYDLSNALFAAFLDPGLTYSSALFNHDVPLAAQGLEEAQSRKVERILDLADVGPGSRVLEVGFGWGTLAIAAARRGAKVTGITLSTEQLQLAQKRVAEAGLVDRIDLRLQDYRLVTGSYDAIVSVEMIEAVGEEYWPEYFRTLDQLLAPGGKVALQAILMDHDRMLATRNSYSWIQKYIFPGGLIPSRTAIDETVERHTTLAVDDEHRFGADYAETLRRWRRRFVANWQLVRAEGMGVLPGLQRGRLRLRLPRRRAAPAPTPLTRASRGPSLPRGARTSLSCRVARTSTGLRGPCLGTRPGRGRSAPRRLTGTRSCRPG